MGLLAARQGAEDKGHPAEGKTSGIFGWEQLREFPLAGASLRGFQDSRPGLGPVPLSTFMRRDGFSQRAPSVVLHLRGPSPSSQIPGCVFRAGFRFSPLPSLEQTVPSFVESTHMPTWFPILSAVVLWSAKNRQFKKCSPLSSRGDSGVSLILAGAARADRRNIAHEEKNDQVPFD